MLLTKEALERDWRSFEYAVVDIEGTGAQHREKEGVVDIAVVLVRDGSVSDQAYHRLLNPGIAIPLFISRIHGVYDKDVVDRPTFGEIESELERFLDDRLLVAHNAPVERRVLNLKLPAYKPALIFDTLKMARALYGSSHKQGLDQLIDRLRLETILSVTDANSKRHGALYDARATAHAFVQMTHENYPSGCMVRDLAAICALDWSQPSSESERRERSEAETGQSSFGW